MSSIEWTDKTWNPLVGCSKISEGCRNCYAINQAYRNAAMGAKLANPGRLAYYQGLTEKRSDRVEWTGEVKFVPEALQVPLKTKQPTKWFVNSMSDLFHESVSDEVLDRIFAVMALTPRHTYQVLTKRPARMLEYFSKTFCKTAHDLGREYPITRYHRIEAEMMRMPQCPDEGLKRFPLPNVWLGVTVENQKAADERIPLLLKTPAAVRFLSIEPLLEPVDLSDAFHWMSADDCNLDWVIVGGESGPNARACDRAWIRSVVEQCKAVGVPIFVKQLGSCPVTSFDSAKEGEERFLIQVPLKLRDRKGGDISEFPEDLQLRQFPATRKVK